MKRNMMRMALIVEVFCVCFFLFETLDLAWGAKDPEYPNKSISFIISLGAGGSTDIASRALVNAADKYLKYPIVSINKEGGNGAIAIMATKSAKPDGYTIGSCTSSSAFVIPFTDNAPYKPLTDVTWIMNYGAFVAPILVSGDAPWKTWKELVDWSKKNPRAIKVGMTGVKLSDNKGVNLWQIEKREGIEFTYLSFKSSNTVLASILGGHINMYASTVDTQTLDYVKAGKLRLLLYLGAEKTREYPNIPSSMELYGIGRPNILSVYGPPKLPDYVVKKLEDVFAKAAKDNDFITIMDRMNMPITYMDRPTLVKHINDIYSEYPIVYKKLKAEEEAKMK